MPMANGNGLEVEGLEQGCLKPSHLLDRPSVSEVVHVCGDDEQQAAAEGIEEKAVVHLAADVPQREEKRQNRLVLPAWRVRQPVGALAQLAQKAVRHVRLRRRADVLRLDTVERQALEKGRAQVDRARYPSVLGH